MMKIKFWGVRGSIPTPITTKQIKEKLIVLAEKKAQDKFNVTGDIRDFIDNLSPLDFGAIGGNTSCVEIKFNNQVYIFDMGSGMKPLGRYIEKNREHYPTNFHIFLSHTHWDHISGLPFFQPAHNPACHLMFYSPLTDLKLRLEYQQDHRFFPVGFELLKAKTSFHLLKNKIFLNDCQIDYLIQNHPGKSYAYRFQYNNKSLVYMTDLYFDTPNDSVINFCQNADVLIFDSQFSQSEIELKKEYGHSTGEKGVDLAHQSGVKTLILFHHDPDKTDQEIQANYEAVKHYNRMKYNNKLIVKLAYEGLNLDL